ncbi:hypothetical protein GN330_22775 [Nitratireductor sp. CAU 1489]|uniref:Uncharacterized protein n=1 Tax=Nitratireductor arenosus TaxID=2682096 RepID=A0A844QNB4_9HYPH|nr:hypothetical protein [Nitratireductor arenosus]MVB00075.1 hypothetical protein [Nitratireductor arenosus]
MNNLSWLIYLAEVADKVSAWAGAMSIILVMVGIAGMMFIAVAISLDEISVRAASRLVGVWALVTALFAAVHTITPSSRTIYMIAASEIGETVVTSPEAIEMMTDLKAIIKSRLKQELE